MHLVKMRQRPCNLLNVLKFVVEVSEGMYPVKTFALTPSVTAVKFHGVDGAVKAQW